MTTRWNAPDDHDLDPRRDERLAGAGEPDVEPDVDGPGQVARVVQGVTALRAIAAVVAQRMQDGHALEEAQARIAQARGQVGGLDQRSGPVSRAHGA